MIDIVAHPERLDAALKEAQRGDRARAPLPVLVDAETFALIIDDAVVVDGQTYIGDVPIVTDPKATPPPRPKPPRR
jgi:hypothetical protein